mmetsp:Transcript_17050/g.39934  ORF Transcript_17050/g.39934 Transcript_17050/m.39934 type:complete len:200 (-) Transcript_17050:863-1462(-)
MNFSAVIVAFCRIPSRFLISASSWSMRCCSLSIWFCECSTLRTVRRIIRGGSMTVPMSIPPMLSSSSLGAIHIISCTGCSNGPAITPMSIAKKARHQMPMIQTKSLPSTVSASKSSWPIETPICVISPMIRYMLSSHSQPSIHAKGSARPAAVRKHVTGLMMMMQIESLHMASLALLRLIFLLAPFRNRTCTSSWSILS